MTANHEAATSARGAHHHYPPAASCSQSAQARQLDNYTAFGPETVRYIVHTETDGIHDHRLQVSHEASSSKQPLRPAYFRERILVEQNEIVDNIVDANTGRTCWTIHRPTRGWYLYLRSPALPQGTAISIRSAKRDEQDPTASPLTFSVNTKVRMEALTRIKPRINLEPCSPILAENENASSNKATDSLNQGLAIQPGAQSAKQDVALAATGRENRKTTSGGHARRRSGATGSGSHAIESKHLGKRLSSVVTSSPMIPEVDDEDQRASQLANDPSLSRLAIPSDATSSASSPLSSWGDRPYSPIQPSTSNFFASSLAPRTSMFLLTDGRGPKDSATTQSWARWACSILPSEIRPSLSLDADKSFGLYWLDCPTGGQDGGESAEVARFEDHSGRWMWNSHTRGRLTLQTRAMQSVGLEQEFWIAAALAYIQFLEDKDAYDAARDA